MADKKEENSEKRRMRERINETKAKQNSSASPKRGGKC